MSAEYSLEELAEAVREWCDKHKIVPANGQAAEHMTERSIRYYRTIGLLDAPSGNYVKIFRDKHRLQLIAIRIYQAQGLPLRKIRDELYGKSEAELRQLAQSAARTGPKLSAAFLPPDAVEQWSVMPLDDDFLLVSRSSRSLPASVIQKLKDVLADAAAPGKLNPTRN